MLDNEKYYRLLSNRVKKNKYLMKKILLIINNIPEDVKNIIDIGCGDGLITNELNNYFNVIGVDRNQIALKYVEGKKIISSSENIPVKNSSFDMVFSSELIEHLENNNFKKTINEMKRISNKYIFLTFPNNEKIGKDFIKCPNCGLIFNRTYHLRSLSIKKIKKLFPKYNILKYFTFGTGKRGYNKILLNIKHKHTPSTAWIPQYWTKNSDRITLCPKCENKFKYKYRFNLLASVCDFLNVFFSPKKPYWMFVLLSE